MIDKIITLQWGFYGGGIGTFLSYLETAGFFSYVLPFLLIFALVFGILTRANIFEQKGINGALALVVALLSLQFHFVPLFFSEIFPRMGIALAVILVLLILTGLFLDPSSKITNYGLLGVGVIIFIVVLVKTFGWMGWGGSYYLWYYNWPQIAGVIIFLVIIGLIIGGGGKERKLPDYNPLMWSRATPGVK